MYYNGLLPEVLDKIEAIFNHEEEPGIDLDVYSGDAAIYIHTTTYASMKREIALRPTLFDIHETLE